jgi:prophage DNA circulation protein
MAMIPSRPPGSIVAVPDPPGRKISGAIANNPTQATGRMISGAIGANPNNPIWRRRLQLASYKSMPFYVDQQGRSSGRRVVTFEYPKRDIPYAEDMGRSAIRYQMTGYLIQAPGPGPNESPTLYNGMPRDYDVARDALEGALMSPLPGTLVDPYNPRYFVTLDGYNGTPIQFICERYSITESREKGGFCQLEMTFVESGLPAVTLAGLNSSAQNSSSQVNNAANATTDAQSNNTDTAQSAANSQDPSTSATAPVQVPSTPVPPGTIPPDIAIPF